MRTLIIILLAAFWFANVPTYVANAQETDTDDVFADEDSAELPEMPDDISMEGAPSLEIPKPIDESNAPQAAAEPKPKKEKVAPAPKAEKHHAKKEKHEPKKSERKAASAGGFKTTKADCPMHADASDGSSVVTTIKGSKKIWTENHSEGWVKAFRKDGHGFLSSECFE